MSQCYISGKKDVMILACSGASNVGQLANRAAVELTQEGVGTMSCLSAIGGKLEEYVRAATNVPALVVMDGCRTGCALATLERAGVPVRGYMVLTEMGIKKTSDLNINPDELKRVKAEAKKRCVPVKHSLDGYCCPKHVPKQTYIRLVDDVFPN